MNVGFYTNNINRQDSSNTISFMANPISSINGHFKDVVINKQNISFGEEDWDGPIVYSQNRPTERTITNTAKEGTFKKASTYLKNVINPDKKENTTNGNIKFKIILIVEKNPYEFSIEDITKLLSESEVKNTANIRFANIENSTLLHLLAERKIDDEKLRKKQLNLISYLVKLGADINAKNAIGNTPLSIAAMRGDEILAGFLVKNGANPNIGNKFGCTPIFYAERGKHTGIVKLLQGIKE